MEPTEPACFHCGEPVPAGLDLEVEIEGRPRAVCCAGCHAVARLIHSAGLERYYRYRETLGRRVDPQVQAVRAAWRQIDDRESLWGRAEPDGSRELLLQTEGIRCAACAWLIRSRLESLGGIRAVQVDAASGYTRIHWEPGRLKLSDVAGALFDIGYVPHLPLAESEEEGRREERRQSLKRLGVAGLGMMQVMMFAVGLYAGDFGGDMSPAARGFLTWVSLVVTLPVLLYSGRVFFTGAWRGLRAGRPGMDLPVALAIGLAFVASCVNFFRGEGTVWFDSVVMFIFFLTLGRHVELVLRHRNLQAGSALARLLPEWAQRVCAGSIRTVPAFELTPGDRVRVSAGTAFPGDGRILEGRTDVDEGLLTGESRPRLREAGDDVVAGTVNLSQSVDIEISAAAADSTVSALGRLLLQAQAQRSDREGIPDWLVPGFTVSVIALAVVTGLFWSGRVPELAFPAALAVLVASCPCALSLALPAVRAASSRALLADGLLLARGDALQRLSAVDTVVFDKTGTLTLGAPERAGCVLNTGRDEWDEATLLAVAAALESHSAHPVAHAFRTVSGEGLKATCVTAIPGQGMEGESLGRRWRIGSRDFVDPGAAPAVEEDRLTTVWLGDEAGWIIRWTLEDRLRPGSLNAVRELQGRGLDLRICSGDAEGAVREVAARLGIPGLKARCSPTDKLDFLAELQAGGRTVLMVGDGVNDGPVLAAADVSMTVQGASDLANSTADLILTAVTLERVPRAMDQAHKAARLVRQNLAWALIYNLSVLPLAVTGWLQPWMAAIGMSASSLLVVLNATRMNRNRRDRSPAGQGGFTPEGKAAG